MKSILMIFVSFFFFSSSLVSQTVEAKSCAANAEACLSHLPGQGPYKILYNGVDVILKDAPEIGYYAVDGSRLGFEREVELSVLLSVAIENDNVTFQNGVIQLLPDSSVTSKGESHSLVPCFDSSMVIAADAFAAIYDVVYLVNKDLKRDCCKMILHGDKHDVQKFVMDVSLWFDGDLTFDQVDGLPYEYFVFSSVE